jgi:hypothetical protein
MREWRRVSLYNEDLHTSYSAPNILKRQNRESYRGAIRKCKEEQEMLRKDGLQNLAKETSWEIMHDLYSNC